MNKTTAKIAFLFFALGAISCNNAAEENKEKITVKSFEKGTYAYDAEFLRKHGSQVIELKNADSSAKVLLSGDYQGRVMTSTATGDSGTSFGWLNYELISAKEKRKQFNPVGGEERFWMGPEGGQYSIYFKGGDSFNIQHWQVPAVIDTLGYQMVYLDSVSAVFYTKAILTNYSGSVFNIDIKRKISLLNSKDVSVALKTTIPAAVNVVGYETDNGITNMGNNDWTKDKGLLSIWLLGMFTPTPQTVVMIPFSPVKNARSLITDNYFGPIPAERLQVKDSILYFTCDGKYRSKIGLSPLVAKPMATSFDFKNNVLTIVIPSVDKNADYVNSKWENQKQPYKGDVINSYNDGPLADGTQMGPFYEIESSSPALALKKGQTGNYKQITCHLQGDYADLKELARQLLGVNLDELKR